MGESFALGHTINEDQVHHADIGVEYGLEEYASLNALNRDLPGHFLDRDIVRDLDQQVLVRLRNFAIVRLLCGECALHSLLRLVGHARRVLVLDHIDSAFEPLGEEHGILSAAWLT